MTSLTTLTELDAVNIMLSTIGESPVSSLSADQSTVDVSLARQILREVSVNVLEEGWQFNTEKEFPMTPEADTGFISIPADCIQIDASTSTPISGNSYGNRDVAMRGGKLYDRTARTFVFTGSLTVDMVILLDFQDMPQAARHYITIRAARVFQQRLVGSAELNGFTSQDETRARAALKKLDSNNADYNILTGSWSVARVLAR